MATELDAAPRTAATGAGGLVVPAVDNGGGIRGSGTAMQRMRRQIDLPVGVAVWVLLAHALTLFSPLALTWQVHVNGEALASILDEPFWLHVTALLFVAGSAFEIAQNTADRWYYEGPYAAVSDLLFNGFIALGLGAMALAAGVDQWWVVAIVIAAGIAFPVLYLLDQVPYPATGVLGIVGVGAMFVALDDPVIFLLLACTTGLNLWLLALIVKTRAQALHGGIALVNGIGLLAVPFALHGAVNDARMGWGALVGIVIALAVTVAALHRPLSRLSATVRPSGWDPDA